MSIHLNTEVTDDLLSESIARLLASNAWRLCNANKLGPYLTNIFGTLLPESPQIKKLFVSEAEGGDFERGQLFEMKTWWELDANGFRASHTPEFLKNLDDPQNSAGDYYYTPFLRFYAANGRLVIGETFGPNILIRKKALLVVSERIVALDNVCVCWHSQVK